jgi:hypothetical protein
MKTKNRTAQMFFIEMALAILLFSVSVGLYFRYVSTTHDDSEVNVETLMKTAKDISSSLVSQGYPEDWSTGNVQRIGLTNDDNRINETKLGNFRNLDYDETKSLLATQFDYYVFFRYRNGSSMIINGSAEGIGKQDVISTNVTTLQSMRSMVKVERILIFRSDIVRMIVYAWSI